MPVLINSIEAGRARVLAVACPRCNAAPTSLCYNKVIDSGGVQNKHTNLFHEERIVKAQNMTERALDFTHRIRQYLNSKSRA